MGMSTIGSRVALVVAACVGATARGDDTKCTSLLQAQHVKAQRTEDPYAQGSPQVLPGAGRGAIPGGGCAGSLVMVDTRPLGPVASLQAGQGDYPKKAAAINYAYTRQHGYRFTYVRFDVPPELVQLNWTCKSLKPYVFRQLVEQRIGLSECTWALFIDSDAMVRDPRIPLSDLLENVSSQLGGPGSIDRVSVVFERESGASPAKINAGAMLFDHDSAHDFFTTWIQEQLRPENHPLRSTWPAEQGVLEQLLARGSSMDVQEVGIHDVPSIENKVGIIGPRTMNDPHGWFVRHFWGNQEGLELRETEFDEALSALNLGQTTDFNSVMQEITDNATGTYMNTTLPSEVTSMLLQQASRSN